MYLKGVATGDGNYRRFLKMLMLLRQRTLTGHLLGARNCSKCLTCIIYSLTLTTPELEQLPKVTQLGKWWGTAQTQGLAGEPRLFTSVPRHVPGMTGPPAPCSFLNCRIWIFFIGLL